MNKQEFNIGYNFIGHKFNISEEIRNYISKNLIIIIIISILIFLFLW